MDFLHETMLNEYEELDVSEKLIKKLQRDLWVTRLMMVFCSLLMIVILASGYYLYQVVQVYVKQAEGYVAEIITYAEGMKPAMTRIQEVDVDSLCQTFSELSEAFAEVDFEQLANQLETLDLAAVSEKLNALDVETINAKLDSLDMAAINEKLDSLDMAAINEKLDSLDLEELSAKIYALDVDKINATIGGIDTELLGSTLANLNEAVDTVKDISEKLQQVALIFH